MATLYPNEVSAGDTDNSPTPKQERLLQRWGVEVPETRQDTSDLIDRLYDRRARYEYFLSLRPVSGLQRRLLREYGCPVTPENRADAALLLQQYRRRFHQRERAA